MGTFVMNPSIQNVVTRKYHYKTNSPLITLTLVLNYENCFNNNHCLYYYNDYKLYFIKYPVIKVFLINNM